MSGGCSLLPSSLITVLLAHWQVAAAAAASSPAVLAAAAIGQVRVKSPAACHADSHHCQDYQKVVQRQVQQVKGSACRQQWGQQGGVVADGVCCGQGRWKRVGVSNRLLTVQRLAHLRPRC